MPATPSSTPRGIVITGGGTGIGRGLAAAFLENGDHVLLCGRRHEVLKEAAHQLMDQGPANQGDILTRTADVTQPADMEAVAQAAHTAWGRLEVWINNAGLMERGTLPEADEDHVRRQLTVNVEGVVNGCRAAVRRMRESGGGVILNISSYLATHAGATATVPIYTASKGAVSALTRSLAVRHGPEGIRVNAICPAFVPTALNAEAWEAFEDRAARFQELAERYPLGRLGSPRDVGHAAVFLAGEGASWITGQELYVDGGLSAL